MPRHVMIMRLTCDDGTPTRACMRSPGSRPARHTSRGYVKDLETVWFEAWEKRGG